MSFAQSLKLSNVCFTYPGVDRPALADLSMDIKHGTSVAIVGGSGAGKSTLIDVILGLRQPSSGRITIDGVDLLEVLDSWQSTIGYVPQEIYLLEMTLAENIGFDQNRVDVDIEQLQRVVSQAQLTQLVEDLPQGIDTFLGERGARLSGGQRQRVGIARALYRNPKVLILDEATSALDNETENELVMTLRALAGELTTIVVAHRLSTVRHCDIVVFLRNGRIEDAGSFADLRRRNADFERLVQLGSIGESDA